MYVMSYDCAGYPASIICYFIKIDPDSGYDKVRIHDQAPPPTIVFCILPKKKICVDTLTGAERDTKLLVEGG